MQKEGIEELTCILLTHVKNITSRNARCDYFSSLNRRDKCIAVEKMPEEVHSQCEHYDPSRETNCGYKWNYETPIKEELDIKEVKRCGIDYPADVDIDSIRAGRAAK